MKTRDKLRVMAEAEKRNAARVARHSAEKALRGAEGEGKEDANEGSAAVVKPVATGDIDKGERGPRSQ